MKKQQGWQACACGHGLRIEPAGGGKRGGHPLRPEHGQNTDKRALNGVRRSCRDAHRAGGKQQEGLFKAPLGIMFSGLIVAV